MNSKAGNKRAISAKVDKKNKKLLSIIFVFIYLRNVLKTAVSTAFLKKIKNLLFKTNILPKPNQKL